MEWAVLLQIAQTVFNLGMPAIMAWGLPTLVSYLNSKHINTTVIEAVGRAAGAAFAYAQTNGKSLKDPAAFAEAVRVGVAYLESRIPDTLNKAGIAGFEKDRMVGAELGRQLAIGTPAAVSAVDPAPVSPASLGSNLRAVMAEEPPITEPVPVSSLSLALSDDTLDRLANGIAAKLVMRATSAAHA